MGDVTMEVCLGIFGPGCWLQPQEAIICFFVLNETRRKFTSFESLIDHLPFVVRNLWPKNIILAKI